MFQYTYPRNLSTFLSVLLLCSFGLANAPAPAHSPEANTELICHTSHASECYPAVFQPTEYFQRIHDDQSIPPGLHVRLNLATGLKEARLNVPEPEDVPKADLVIIDNSPLDQGNGDQVPLTRDTEAQKIEDYMRQLKQKPIAKGREESHSKPSTVPSDQSEDMGLFSEQIAIITTKDPSDPTNIPLILSAIESLTGLVNDLEQGIALTRDAKLSQQLIRYINPPSIKPNEISSASAQLLGTAIQNNAEALEALLSHFEDPGSYHHTPIMAVRNALENAMSAKEQDTILQKRLVFLLANLSTSLPQLEGFLSHSGLAVLHHLFTTGMEPEVDGRDKLRMTIANYLQDHILMTMDSWPSRTLTENFPPGIGHDIIEFQTLWRGVMRGMGPWCKALKLSAGKYGAGTESAEAGDAFMSIYEARDMLEMVLRDQGCDEGCECKFDEVFAE